MNSALRVLVLRIEKSVSREEFALPFDSVSHDAILGAE